VARGGPWATARATAALLVATALTWIWWQTPRTPDQLFARRCRTCHPLPNMAAYRKSEIRGIVTTMLTKNGADEVITPDEARTIIAYLEEVARP